MGYLIAFAKKNGFKVKYIDMVAHMFSIDQLLTYISSSKPILIGFTAYTVQIYSVEIVAKEIKKRYPNITITIGGAHATAIPRETLSECPSIDFAICGEGEYPFVQVIERLKQRISVKNVLGVVGRNDTEYSFDSLEIKHKQGGQTKLEDLPFPDWSVFDLSKYPGVDPHHTNLELPVSTSRGCPSKCVFCVRPFGRIRRKRTIQSIVQEIKYNIAEYGCESIFFADETFVADINFSRKLFDAFIKEGLYKKIRWSCETRVDFISEDLFSKMKEAGCYYVFFGIESGNDHVLKIVNKGFSVNQIKKAVQLAKNAKLICSGSFILGLPGETEKSILDSIKLAKELDIYSVTFPIACPFPGTEIRRMAKENEYGLRILSNRWDKYGKQYPGVMDSETLTIDKLRELQKKAYDYNPKKPFPKELLK